MRRLLRILRGRETPPGDLTLDDWTPIPPGSQARTDLAAWLQEGEPPAAQPGPPRASWVDVLKSFGEHLTDTELRIIRQQLG